MAFYNIVTCPDYTNPTRGRACGDHVPQIIQLDIQEPFVIEDYPISQGAEYFGFGFSIPLLLYFTAYGVGILIRTIKAV